MKAMTAGWGNAMKSTSAEPEPETEADSSEDLDAIKKQLADLQNKLSKLK